MQILYGYSNPSDEGGDGQTVNHWLPASEVPNWEFVIGARLSLLARSPENMGDGTVRSALSTWLVRRLRTRKMVALRHTFFSSIGLRNRQLVM